MQAISWTCPTVWWIAASALSVLVMFAALVHCHHRQARHAARSKARHAAMESEAHALQESMLQSGQGLILRFEAIARQLPVDHPVRRDIAQALDRAERILEKGVDQVQHRRAAEHDSSD
jgi:hypothetical protein